MILFNGPNTPFGRMALVTALELGIAVENRVVHVGSADWLDAMNPLRQIPSLLLDSGAAVFDSRVICTFFAGLADAPEVVPADVTVQTRWALIVGLMEAAVGRQMERIRPAGERSLTAIVHAERRIANTLRRLEAEADDLCDGLGRIDRIAAASALDYIDFRYPHDWRGVAPRLAGWLGRVLERPSMTTTRPMSHDAV